MLSIFLLKNVPPLFFFRAIVNVFYLAPDEFVRKGMGVENQVSLVENLKGREFQAAFNVAKEIKKDGVLIIGANNGFENERELPKSSSPSINGYCENVLRKMNENI